MQIPSSDNFIFCEGEQGGRPLELNFQNFDRMQIIL